jgi:hypothetical protein
MGYTTTTKVRQAAGFVGNNNISDAFISSIITRAENTFDSYVGEIYTLPLPKYFAQTITFSGTGSGTSTMTITIDGESFSVVMASSLTASQAADRFRNAASTATSFVTDNIGNGATVTIYSTVAGDSTDVTISSTDPQTVSGITATGGTVTQVVIPFVEAIVTDIAVARLMIIEYGPESQDTDKDGYKLLALATATLKSIQSKNEKLYNFVGLELPRSRTRRLAFYPTNASKTNATNPTANKITMNRNF